MPKPIKYLSLREQIRDNIISGIYPIGHKLPTENELSLQYGISRQTVRQALATLEKDGYIEKRQGSGSIVKNLVETSWRSRNIAVVTTYIGDYIFPDVLRGIEGTLRSHGYSPLIMATGNRVDKERDILLGITSHPVEGLIVEGTKTALPNPNITLYQSLYGQGLPIVFLHGYYSEFRPPVYVVADDRAGAFEAVRFLYNKGHRDIAGIFKSDYIQGHWRFTGYMNALLEFNLPVNDDRVLWYTTESRDSLTSRRILQLIEDCTALVCNNDQIAVQVIGLLRETHIKIPGDLAIIGFDDSVYGNLTSVKITSMSNGTKQLGVLAAEKMLEMLGGGRPQPSLVPWTLVEKEST